MAVIVYGGELGRVPDEAMVAGGGTMARTLMARTLTRGSASLFDATF